VPGGYGVSFFYDLKMSCLFVSSELPANGHPKNELNDYSSSYARDHGRPQTFFQGRAKFSRGGKTYYFLKNTLKRYYFPQKKSKNILFWLARGGDRGGQGPPLALPCGRPCSRQILFLMKYFRYFYWFCHCSWIYFNFLFTIYQQSD